MTRYRLVDPQDPEREIWFYVDPVANRVEIVWSWGVECGNSASGDLASGRDQWRFWINHEGFVPG